MYDEQTIARFVELRSLDRTFNKITEELKVPKMTLIRWSRKYHHRIQNLRACNHEALAEKCQLSRQHTLEALGDDLHRIREELAKRDLSDVPTHRLMALASLLRNEANRRNGPLQLSESAYFIPPEDTEHQSPTITWES